MARGIYDRLRPILFKFFDKKGWDIPDNTYVCSLGDYCMANELDGDDIEITEIHADGINFGWLAMYDAYRSFYNQGEEFDAVTDFKEYSGEKTLFGLIREWRMEGTGVKLLEEE